MKGFLRFSVFEVSDLIFEVFCCELLQRKLQTLHRSKTIKFVTVMETFEKENNFHYVAVSSQGMQQRGKTSNWSIFAGKPPMIDQ